MIELGELFETIKALLVTWHKNDPNLDERLLHLDSLYRRQAPSRWQEHVRDVINPLASPREQHAQLVGFWHDIKRQQTTQEQPK